MEKKIEGTVDKLLESISPGMHVFSIGFEIVLILLGIFLLFKNRGLKEKKGASYAGLICFVLGIIAVISRFVQMR